MTKTKPKITTLIPTYRRPELLERAIISALQQGGDEVQVCIYDNNSGDSTADTVAKLAQHDSRIKYYCHETNIGGLKNFQFALSQIDTDYFSILSDDDFLLPNFYAHTLTALEQNPEAIFAAGTTIRMDTLGRIYDAHVDSWPREGIYLPPEGIVAMVNNNQICWTGILFRKQALVSTGGLDETVGGPSDLDFLLRLVAQHAYFIVKQPCAVFMLHQNSFSDTSPLSAFWPGWKNMIFNLSRILEQQTEIQKIVCQKLQQDAIRMLFRRSLNALAKKKYEFAFSASSVLKAEFNINSKYLIIRSVLFLLKNVPFAQKLYSKSYFFAENLSISSRSALQQKYRHLAKLLTATKG